jgi:hypothetical protein
MSLASSNNSSPGFQQRRWREQQGVAVPQAARGWTPPPDRHFKTQSCLCLGSAFEVKAFQPSPFRLRTKGAHLRSARAEARHAVSRQMHGDRTHGAEHQRQKLALQCQVACAPSTRGGGHQPRVCGGGGVAVGVA